MLLRRTGCAVLAALAMACGGDAVRGEATGAAADATDAHTGDASTADAADDASPGDDASDADTHDAHVSTSRCAVPTPRLSTDPLATALAAGPDRCGRPGTAWLDAPDLGTVTRVEPALDWPRDTLAAAASVQGLVRHRPFDHDVTMHAIAYTTQAHGARAEATALVAAPSDTAPDGAPWPVALVLHGTTGFNDDCAPSNDIDWQIFTAFVAAWGYVAVAPDYIGLHAFGDDDDTLHPYLVGEPTAMASLDAVRAALRVVDDGVFGDACAAPNVVVWGASQGGHAALWVDRLAPWYAPELAIDGVAAVIAPSDLLGQGAAALDEVVPGTANAIAILVTLADWFDLGAELEATLAPGVAAAWQADLGGPCTSGRPVELDDGTTLADLFAPDALATLAGGGLADLDPFGCLVAESGLPTTAVPRRGDDPAHYGILFAQAGRDQIVDVETEQRAFGQLCAGGLPIEYLECEGARHGAGALHSLPEAMRFLDARAAHTPWTPPESCEPTPAVVCEGGAGRRP